MDTIPESVRPAQGTVLQPADMERLRDVLQHIQHVQEWLGGKYGFPDATLAVAASRVQEVVFAAEQAATRAVTIYRMAIVTAPEREEEVIATLRQDGHPYWLDWHMTRTLVRVGWPYKTGSAYSAPVLRSEELVD